MKEKIHPQMHMADVICACGERFQALSTKKEVRVELCSKCHPFFTGKQKLVDTAGRYDRFMSRWGLKRPTEEAEDSAADSKGDK